MKVKQSTSLDDIYDANLRSASSYSGICICELGSLDELIGMDKAEKIRKKLLQEGVKTRQLTNHAKMNAWTEQDEFVNKTMEIRFVTLEVFAITREILIFDDTVAMYRKLPDIQYLEIKDIAFAQAMRQLFESLWSGSKPMRLGSGGSAQIKR